MTDAKHATPYHNHEGRVQRLQEKLREGGFDGLLVNHLKNICYLVGFTGTTGYLVVTAEGATLFVDGRYTEQARRQATVATVQETVRDVLAGVLAHLRERPGRYAVEASHLVQSEYARIQESLPAITLAPTTGLVESLRARKDSAELEAIRRATAIADAAYEDFLTWLRPGMREREVAARLEYFQRLQGGDRKPSETVVSSGPRTALPHGIATDRVIEPGEPVMIDIGAVVDGYTSDLTRTVHLGEPAAEFREIYQIVLEAQRKAEEGVRPGMTGREVDAIAREHIAAAGYGEYFVHTLGHSFGLEIHEHPQFSKVEEQVIEPGMVITVEPGIYLPGKFGVRTEDVIVVTGDGCEVLTHSPHELKIL